MPELKRTCGHADVGDCWDSCFGAGVYEVKCGNCGNDFDLNHDGKFEHSGLATDFACQDCPLPSEYALPQLSLSLVALEEGLA